MKTDSASPSGPAAAALFAQASEHHRAGRLADAATTLQLLLKRDPAHVEGWNLGGIISSRRGDFAGAVRYFQKAVALGAGAGVLANLGFSHQKLGDAESAERAYNEALRREPTLAFAWQKMASLQEALGRRERAIDCYRRALALDPADLKSHGEALYLRRFLADWNEEKGPTPKSLLAAFAAAKRSDFAPTLLLALAEATPAAQKAAALTFARTQWGSALAERPLADAARADAGKLRIGYVSPNFRDHAVAYLVTEAIAAHDRGTVEVFLYSTRAQPAADRWRQAAIAAADHFIEIDSLDDDAAARRIRADTIDVLVDLAGYTGHSRLGINARRPAPVIAHWLGYIGTLGEPRLADYVIGDAVATPLENAGHFSEALAQLPRCFQPNGALAPRLPAPTRADQGLPEQGVVYCSFNQTWKIGPAVWDDWCTILRGVPDSVLWLVAPEEPAGEANLRAAAALRGIDRGRVVFARSLPRDEHLARLTLADIALDTFPYNSGTTASDALRAGVPLLTFRGKTFVGRMAASLLHTAGLDDCVLASRSAVVARAIELGLDDGKRGRLRQRVDGAARLSGLFDPVAFARDLERLYAAMHAQRLAGKREPITLAREISR